MWLFLVWVIFVGCEGEIFGFYVMIGCVVSWMVFGVWMVLIVLIV